MKLHDFYDLPIFTCEIKMINKSSIVACYTNYVCYEKRTAFPMPGDEEQKSKWIKFVKLMHSTGLKNTMQEF